MKAKIIVLMLVAGVIISGNPASAQLKDLLNKGINTALDKKLKKDEEERKKKEAEKKKVQGQQTQTGEQGQQPNSNSASNYMQKKMMGMMGMTDVKHETSYSFTSSMSMEMQSIDSVGKKSDKVLYNTFFDKNSRNFAMEFETVDKPSGQKQKSLMIFDYKNWAMLILADKGADKSGIAMKMAKDSTIEAQQKQPSQGSKQELKQSSQELSADNMYYKATGRTKTIAGHSCKEYVYENLDGKVEQWATNDVAFDYSSAYGHMGGMQALATSGTAYDQGMVMEMHFSDKHSQAKSDMTVTDIKPSNPKTINLAGYQIIGMGGAQGQSQGQTQGQAKQQGKINK